MRLWRFPDQVVRLTILVVVAVVAMILVRNRLVPKSFGELGHYRADAVAIAADLPVRFAGSQVCEDCHDEGEVKRASYHRSLSCEVCHGPAMLHAQEGDEPLPVVPRERGEACLYCHSYLPSRPTGFPQIIEPFHNPMDSCIDCHDPHDPVPSEIPEECSACHGQIARTKAVSHHSSVACVTCHEAPAEHREMPRSFRPKKPTDRQFCGQCHDTVATTSDSIPQIDTDTHGGRYLCWQCHYPHFPES